jgi:hypothetical protein
MEEEPSSSRTGWASSLRGWVRHILFPSVKFKQHALANLRCTESNTGALLLAMHLKRYGSECAVEHLEGLRTLIWPVLAQGEAPGPRHRKILFVENGSDCPIHVLRVTDDLEPLSAILVERLRPLLVEIRKFGTETDESD